MKWQKQKAKSQPNSNAEMQIVTISWYNGPKTNKKIRFSENEKEVPANIECAGTIYGFSTSSSEQIINNGKATDVWLCGDICV